MRTVIALRHVMFEDLGLFEDVLRGAGFGVEYREAGEGLIDELDPDLLVVLGGPIGVYEGGKYPFITDELRLLERRLAKGKPALGICLGAQLMAKALGARVYHGGRKEIGWKEMELTPAGEHSPLRHLGTVLHWHGDTFDLPAGATLLASTDLYERQAFSYGSNALAVQFHPEVETRKIERWLVGHAAELAAAGLDVNELRADSQTFGPRLETDGRQFFAEWLAGLW